MDAPRSPAVATVPRPQPKHLLLLLILSMIAVVVFRDRILLDSQHPVWAHYAPFKWWLLPHGVSAALALLLGPWQFSSRLRQRHLHWHRIAGRLYVAGVAIGAPAGIIIEAIKYQVGTAPLRLLVGSIGFGAIFLFTTGKGFVLARHGRIREHRRWMVRSFSVAMVFVEVRCVDSIPWLAQIMSGPSDFFETHHVSDLWLYLALSMSAAELILRYGRPKPVRLMAAAAYRGL